jgi:D-arabinitol 4-dehydrogenase
MAASHHILHLGIGAFHRAHQAVYLDDLIARGDTAWAIIGASLRDDQAATMAALIHQGGGYTLETVTPEGVRAYRRIASIASVLPFDPSLAAVVEVGARPSTRIVSFTVTEAGYYLDARHRLDPSYADLASDLDGTTRCTIYAAVAAILAERRARDAGPLTLMNCDNLRSNGDRFMGGLMDFLHRRGELALAAWTAAHTTAPNAMVDRITPRPPADLAARVLAATGWADQAPVMAEDYIQWVIEDRFANGRPAWEQVGAEMVGSVHAHEEAKIRILNATHSGCAWAGSLIGLGYIHEDVAVPWIRQIANDYVTDDVIPCLDTAAAPSPIDLARYRDRVLHRFANPYLQDTNQRVAMDGFSKLPGFIAPTIRERLAAGAGIAAVARLPALFLAFLQRRAAGDIGYAYHDQAMDEAAVAGWFVSADPVAAFCREPVLWRDLAGSAALTAAVRIARAEVQALVDRHAPTAAAP